MKYIQKGKEPTCLAELKKQKGATFDDLNRNTVGQDKTCKEKVRESLLKEQGYLCAYCMQRISVDRNIELGKPKTEIEHFKSQHRHPKLILDYKNMLAVCNGNADKPSHGLICDKAKSEFDKTHDLFINPLDINREQQIYYTLDGKVTSDNMLINKDLNEILNLNEENLCEERAKLYQIIKSEIRQIKRAYWDKPQTKKSKLQQLKTQWEKRYNDKFRPLCRIPLYLIEKELAKK